MNIKKLLRVFIGITIGCFQLHAETPLFMKLYGDRYIGGVTQHPARGVAGTLDTSIGTDGGKSLASDLGAGVIPQVVRVLTNGYILVAADDAANTQVKVAKFDCDGFIDDSFGTSGIATISQRGVKDLFLDAQGRVVVVGAFSSSSWIARLSADGDLDTANFGGVGADPDGIAVGDATDFKAVGEQQSGRLIVVGKNGTGGVVYGYRSDGQVDQTFNTVLALGSRGFFETGAAAGVYDVAIHPTDDKIYIAYKDASNVVQVKRLKADGSGIDTSFGTSGSIVSGISNITDETQIRIALDSQQRIVVTAVNASNQFVVRRFTAGGGVDISFNTDGSVLTISGVTAPKITHLVTTEEDQMIVMGYDDIADDRMFVARIKNDGTLDTAFSANGLLSYELNASNTERQLRFGAIHPDGRLLLVGYENNSGTDTGVLVRQYTDSYVPEYEQAPRAATAGTIDTTFDTDGLLTLSDLAGYTPKHITIFDDASMLVVADKAADSATKILRLDPRLSLESTFNSSSVLTIANATQFNAFAVDKKYDTTSPYVDTQQGFFVGGSHSSAPWVKRYSAAGVVDSTFAFSAAAGMETAYAIAQQSSGRVLVAGNNGTAGMIAGHKTDGSVDSIFGSSGSAVVTGSSTIHTMVVDSQDRIYIAYKNGSNAVEVKRLCANGAEEDSTFTVSDKIAGASADADIAVALDQNEDLVVAAATSAGYTVRRYAAADGTKDATFNSSGELTVAFAGTAKLSSVQVQTSGKILAVGYNDQALNHKAVQIRLTSTGALDTTFNPNGSVPGVLELDDGTADFELHGLDMHPDRRSMFVGRDATSGNALLGRVVGDDNDYVALVEQAPVAGVEGEFDTSLTSDGTFTLSSLSGIGANTSAHVVRVTSDGKIVVGIEDLTNSNVKVVKLDCDTHLDDSFATSGVATISDAGSIADMHIDVDGKIVTVGNSGGRWIHRHTANGQDDSIFGTSGHLQTSLSTFHTVREQKSGRLVIGGYEGSNGALIGITSQGEVDSSFGGVGDGILPIGTTGIYSLIIDSLDRIYVAYDNGSNQVVLARVRPNGFGLDETFNSGGTPGQFDNALAATITDIDQVRIAFDHDGNILVAGATATGMKLARYTSAGALDTTFGTSGYTVLAESGFVLKDFVVGQDDLFNNDGKIAVIGYKNDTDDRMFVAWFNHDGTQATEFNPIGQVGGAAGTISFVVDEAANATRILQSGAILQDGRLLLAGYEENETSSQDTPLLMRVHGQRYAPEQAQVPLEGAAGEFDVTLNQTGKVAFDFSTSTALDQYGQAIVSLDDGHYLVGGYGKTDADGTYNHFLLAKYTSDGQLVASFGTGEKAGVSVTPLRDASYNEYLYDIAVDHLGRIIAVGYQDNGSGKSLIRRYLSGGTIDTSFGGLSVDPDGVAVEDKEFDPEGTVSTDVTDAFAVGIQSSGRIIVAGEDNSTLNKGVLLAYDIDGALDYTFGINGMWYIDDAAAIYSMTIDSEDNIYVAYKHETSGKASVAKIPYNGNQFVFEFGGAGTGKIADALGVVVSSNQNVKVAVDKDGKVVVAASSNVDNTVLIRRFDTDGTNDATFNSDGSALTITPEGGASDNLVLSRLMTSQAGDYILAGYQDVNVLSTDKFWLARVSAAGVLDTTFNSSDSSPGQNLFTIDGAGTLQKLAGATISSEGKILVVGQETVGGNNHPVVASLYNARYDDEVLRSPAFVSDGGYDTTFNTTGIAYPYSGAAVSTANQSARGVKLLSTGKMMTVVSDGQDSWLVRLNTNGSKDTTFGSTPGSGAEKIVEKVAENEQVSGMELDGCGRTLVFGTSTTNGAYLKRLRTTGLADTTFGGIGTDPAGTRYNVMDTIHSVVELSNGNLAVAGVESSVGKIKMFNSAGAVVTSFATSGVYNNGEAIAAVTANDDDTMYAAVGYDDAGTKKVRIVKLTKTGSLVSDFGTDGVVDAVISDLVRYEDIKLHITYTGQVVVAAVFNSGAVGADDQIAIRRYDADGNPHTTFNSGNQLNLDFATVGSASRYLKDLVMLKNGKIVLVGYQDDNSVVTDTDALWIARVKASGALDETFNADAVANGTGNAAGMYVFSISSTAQQTRRLYGVDIQPDGRIVVAGAESPAANEDVPFVLRIYGDDYVKHVDRFPGYGKPGTFDVAFGTLNDGLEKIYFGNEIDASQIGRGIQPLATGRILLFGYGYTDLDRDKQKFLTARLRPDGSLDTSVVGQNGSISGVRITPSVGSNSEIMLDTFVDRQGRVIASGYIDAITDQAVLRRYHVDNTGRLDNTFRGDGSLAGVIVHPTAEQFKVVGMQGTGDRLIVGGIEASQGVIYAFKDEIGQIDTTFATEGKYTFADSNDIRALVTGLNDTIYVARIVGSDMVVSAIKNDGKSLLTSFGTAGQVTAFSNVVDIGRAWIGIDANNKLVVAATVNDAGHSRIKVKRYTSNGTIDTGFNGGAELTLFTGTQNDRTNVITRVLPLANGKIIIIGYQDITGQPEDYMFALRITSSGSGLDTGFNAEGSIPGLVTMRVYQTGDNSQFNNVAVDSKGRLVIVGQETPDFGGNTPVVVRIHGDFEVAAVSQFPRYQPAFINLQTAVQPGGSGAMQSGSTTSSPPNAIGGVWGGQQSGWGGSMGGAGAWSGSGGAGAGSIGGGGGGWSRRHKAPMRRHQNRT